MLVFVAVVTLLFSAFFSGVEIAFISANKLKLELDKNTGKFPANIISYFSRNESVGLHHIAYYVNIDLYLKKLLFS